MTLDLVPIQTRLAVMAGTDTTIEFQLTEDGAVVNITNDDVKFTAKDRPGGTTKIATKTNTVNGHSAPTSGKTRFTLSAENLVNATTRDQEWWYEVRRVRASDSAELVHIWGRLIVEPAVGVSA